MCTWNRKQNGHPGCSKSDQPIIPPQEQEVSEDPHTTEKTPEEPLLNSLKHLHV